MISFIEPKQKAEKEQPLIAKTFVLSNAGIYDNQMILSLPWDRYRDFVLKLFSLRQFRGICIFVLYIKSAITATCLANVMDTARHSPMQYKKPRGYGAFLLSDAVHSGMMKPTVFGGRCGEISTRG